MSKDEEVTNRGMRDTGGAGAFADRALTKDDQEGAE